MHIPIHDNQIAHHNPCYICVFVVRDVKIAVYLESSGKINFNLVSEICKKRVLTTHNKVLIYLHLRLKDYKNYFFISFTQKNIFCHFLRDLIILLVL